MAMRTIGLTALGIIPAALVGACATVPARHAYYRVPCNTPGAVLATPVTTAAQIPVAPGYAAPGGVAVAPGASGVPAVATCVVAVRDDGYGYYGSPYYGRYGYGYGRYGYGSPFYGSFGLGFGFSSHGGGHFSGSHRFGGHGRRSP